MPVRDLAAIGGGLHGAALLTFCPRCQVGVAHHLEVHEPRLDPDGPEEEQRSGHDDTLPERFAPVVGWRLCHGSSRHLNYRRAMTDLGGGGVDTTRSMIAASLAPGATMCSRVVASRSIRSGERSVSISRRRWRLMSSSVARSFCICSRR